MMDAVSFSTYKYISEHLYDTVKRIVFKQEGIRAVKKSLGIIKYSRHIHYKKLKYFPEIFHIPEEYIYRSKYHSNTEGKHKK